MFSVGVELRIVGAVTEGGQLCGLTAGEGEEEDLGFSVDGADEGDLFSVGAPSGLTGIFFGGEGKGGSFSAEIGQPELIEVLVFVLFLFRFDGGDGVNHPVAIGTDGDRSNGTDLGQVGHPNGVFPILSH